MIWLVVFIVMLLVVGGMALGVMNGRAPLAGSCGGLAIKGEKKECSFCGKGQSKCKRQGAEETEPT